MAGLQGLLKGIKTALGYSGAAKDEPGKKTDRGAAVVIERADGAILLLKRSASATWEPGKWNLPGGEAEKGESDGNCARREAQEEIGIQVGKQSYLTTIRGSQREMAFFHTTDWSGNPALHKTAGVMENSAFAWVPKDKALSWDLVPGLAGVLKRVLADAKTDKSQAPGGGAGAPESGSKQPYKKAAKWFSAGGVIVPSMQDMEHVYLIKPAHHYGPWAFPKGRTEKGEKMTSTAMREVEEETGLQAMPIPGGYLGSGEGSYSITHFWLMVQTGGNPGNHDQEVEEVRLCSFEEAEDLFRGAGNLRDVAILKRAQSKIQFVQEHQPKHPHEYGTVEDANHRTWDRLRVLSGILGPYAEWHQ
jgi:8-oxo-dGTP pyrophosphatase MutT (NUDIX family)